MPVFEHLRILVSPFEIFQTKLSLHIYLEQGIHSLMMSECSGSVLASRARRGWIKLIDTILSKVSIGERGINAIEYKVPA